MVSKAVGRDVDFNHWEGTLTVQRIPQEHFARLQSTTNLIDPLIIKGHPSGLLCSQPARLDTIPELVRVLGLAKPAHWIESPSALHGETPQAECLGVYGASGRDQVVALSAEEQHCRAEAEHDGGKQVGQPEADIALCVDHADLARQRTDVDHQVEVQVDTGNGRRWVDNHSLSVTFNPDVGPLITVLLCNQRRDVGSANM